MQVTEHKREASHYVMDIETIVNCSVFCFEHFKQETVKVFIIHELQNDLRELLIFLGENYNNQEHHVSFNGLAFDSQIIEFLIRDSKRLLRKTAEQVALEVYNLAQETINRQSSGGFNKYNQWNLRIKQIDVFKMNHWDNANKRSSLKWLEYAMDWHNVQEMPIHHSQPVKTIEELCTVVKYCMNDVRATKRVMLLSKPLIDVRKKIQAKYGIDCYNYSNTKLGSELLLKLYCSATHKSPGEVRHYRTNRSEIKLADILFPYIKFQSMDLIGFHEMLKSKIIRNTKHDFSYNLKFMGYEFSYALGGIHQCIDPGIYKEDDSYIIKDLDVASLYPSIACENEMYPAHLGKEFFRVYKEDIVGVRLAEKQKKEGKDLAIIEGFKEAANATYGNSNNQYSWLYDPQYTMQTTVNGQLLISMLVEDLLLNLKDCQLLQTNTDGATIRLLRSDLDKYQNICKKWEQVTKLKLEFADYKAMYIWDVNNYIAQYTDGKTKCKGRFEWEDLQNHKYTHLHKNKSHLIIAKALFNYFINNIPPERYLADNRNIFDYCAGVKIKGEEWKFVEMKLQDGSIQKNDLQKIVRYYVSKKGSKIVKVNTSDNREIETEAGRWMQTVFNVYKELPWEQYNVDDSYYLETIYKEISSIIPKVTNQLKMDL